MKKNLFILWGVPTLCLLALTLAGCGSSNTPTTPGGGGNPTPTPTPTHTPIPGISWFTADVANTNGTGSADVVLALNGQPVTNANAVLSGPALTGPVTLLYNNPTTILGTVYSDYYANPINYQAGQPYTITTVAGGLTAFAPLTAVGGVFTSAPDASAVSWTVNGTTSIISMLQFGSNQFTYQKVGNGISPASVPVTSYAVPGSYRLDAFVYGYTATLTGGTIVNANPSAISAQAYYGVLFVSSPTATPTITQTPTVTPTPTITLTSTDTSTPTLTLTPTDTSTPTITSTPTSTLTPTSTFTPSWTPSFTATPTDTGTSTFTDTATFTPTATLTSTFTSTVTNTSTSTPSSPATVLSAFATFGSGLNLASGLVYQSQSGNLWVADWGTASLTEWTTTGTLVATVTSVGGAGNLSQPIGLALDPSGDLYVADNSKHNVYVFDPAGNYLTAVNSSLFPVPLNPQGVAVNSAGTTLYVGGSISVCAIPINAGSPPTFGGATLFNTTGPGALSNVDAVAVDGFGNIWVTGQSNGRVAQYSPAGDFLQSSNPGTASFSSLGITVDPSGSLYVTDNSGSNHFVAAFNSLGGFAATWGASKLYQPMGITNDGHGNFYVADRGFGQILAFH